MRPTHMLPVFNAAVPRRAHCKWLTRPPGSGRKLQGTHLLHARLAVGARLPADLGALIAANVNVGKGEQPHRLIQHLLQEGERALLALQAGSIFWGGGSDQAPQAACHANAAHPPPNTKRPPPSHCPPAQPCRSRPPTAQYTSSWMPQWAGTSCTCPVPAAHMGRLLACGWRAQGWGCGS